MANNGSPKPIFDTDESTYVLVTIPIHEGVQVTDQASDQDEDIIFSSLNDIVAFCNQANDQVNDQVSDQVEVLIEQEINDRVLPILFFIRDSHKSRTEILTFIGLKNHTDNKRKYIDPIHVYGWIEFTIPGNPKDRNQKYKITESGKRLIKLINKV